MDVWDAATLASAAIATGLVVGRLWAARRRSAAAVVLGRGKRGWLRWLELALPAVIALILAEVVLHALDAGFHVVSAGAVAPWFDAPVLRGVGGIGQAGAVWLLGAALRALGASYRLGVDHERPGGLVTGSVFAWSRHPVYLALAAWFLGVWLVYPNTFFFFIAVGGAVTLHLLARREEAVFLQRHGEAYRAYRERVPAYFPLPGRGRRR